MTLDYKPGSDAQWPSRRQMDADLRLTLVERRMKPPALPEGKPYYYQNINPFSAAQIEKALAKIESLRGKIVYSDLPLCMDSQDRRSDPAAPSARRLKVQIGGKDFDHFLLTFYNDSSANENYMYLETVRAGKMGTGVLKKIFPDVMKLARSLKCPTIRLSASHVGKYAWLRYGFLPYPNEWESVARSIPTVAVSILGEYPAIYEIQTICAKTDPSAIHEIASLQEGSFSIETVEGIMDLPLGKALLISKETTGWGGMLDLRNRRICRAVERYCGGMESAPVPAAQFFDSIKRARAAR